MRLEGLIQGLRESLVNDFTITRDAVYFTDSCRPYFSAINFNLKSNLCTMQF
jgi:hypothetical protein